MTVNKYIGMFDNEQLVSLIILSIKKKVEYIYTVADYWLNRKQYLHILQHKQKQNRSVVAGNHVLLHI